MADKMGEAETSIIPGRGAVYGKGSSGEGAMSPDANGENPDSEGGSSGSGWRGGNPQRSQGSTGSGVSAVQAPNRPK